MTFDDVRIAERLAAGECGSPDVRLWMNQFNAKAMTHCKCFGHPFQDAEDLVQNFWLWVYAAAPPGVFSKYSPERGPLLNFAFICIKHAVGRWGKDLAVVRRVWDSLDEAEFAVESDAPSALDVLVTREGKGRRVPNPAALEAHHQVEECLWRLGMGVGEPGWLLCALHVENRTYIDLVEEVFGKPRTLDELEKKSGTLRKRAWDASNRFLHYLRGARIAATAAPLDRRKRTMPKKLQVSAEAATRLLHGLGVACYASPPLPDEDLLNYASGSLLAADRRRVKTHVKDCPCCTAHVKRLRTTLEHFKTPTGRERLVRLWTSFREASAQVLKDSRSGQRGKFDAAAARAHEQYRQSIGSQAVPSWKALAGDLRLSNYHQVSFAKHLLGSAGLTVREVRGRRIALLDIEQTLKPAEIRRLAKMEHERFVAERTLQGWRYGKKKNVMEKRSPYLVAWAKLSPAIQDLDVQAVRALPATLSEKGLEVRVPAGMPKAKRAK